MNVFLLVCAYIFIGISAIPFLASKKWWVRFFDFPHLQMASSTFVILVLLLVFMDTGQILDIATVVLLAVTIIYQAIIIFPYTPFAKKQLASTTIKSSDKSIKIFAANVLQDNKDFETFKAVFSEVDPDVAILLETNKWWQKKLSVFKKRYNHFVEYPMDNYYGMILLSKFPLKDIKVKFLMAEDIPSIHGKVQLKNGTWVRFYCLHPMPPSPTENSKSLDRDAELLLVAKEIIVEKDYPVIVMGDLNDVAWSHSTRMFQRISQLLDPRIGRGFFNTFNVGHKLMRWPLDHVFVSNDFKLAELKRLDTIGSDHFPIYANLCYECNTKENDSPGDATDADKEESKETIKEGLKENGKSHDQ